MFYVLEVHFNTFALYYTFSYILQFSIKKVKFVLNAHRMRMLPLKTRRFPTGKWSLNTMNSICIDKGKKRCPSLLFMDISYITISTDTYIVYVYFLGSLF